ncbi:hypothetical protein BAC3_02290 [uncultured bacterium]|jgi:DNA polymerase III delta prime subunit|nr:hypothetical protein [Candidatus Dojkabacteria bacterium]CAG1772055.1 hypothetical protein BAC3_02290 [uncultured bacterium]
MKYQSVIVESREAFQKDDIESILKDKLNISEPILNTNIFMIEKPEDKASIGIGDVSNVVEWAYRKDTDLKLIEIKNADLLTDQAQNAMLKLIEEPPENVLVLLITPNSSSILQTIRSRCILITTTAANFNTSELAKKFIEAGYLERTKIIDKMLSEDTNRASVAEFIEELLRLNLNKKNTDSISEIKEVYRAVKRGVNLKLCLDYLNILI